MFKLTLLKGLLLSGALITVATVTTGAAVLNNRVESPKIQPAIMVDAEHTPLPTASVKSTTIKKPAAVQVSSPAPESDPVIDCKFANVPVTKMKQSECAKAGECQIGDKWYIYTSQEKCNSDRQVFYANRDYVPVGNYSMTTSPLPIPSLSPPTDNSKYLAYKSCSDAVMSDYYGDMEALKVNEYAVMTGQMTTEQALQKQYEVGKKRDQRLEECKQKYGY